MLAEFEIILHISFSASYDRKKKKNRTEREKDYFIKLQHTLLCLTFTFINLSLFLSKTSTLTQTGSRKEKKSISLSLRLYVTGRTSLLSSGYVHNYMCIMKCLYANHRHVPLQEVTSSVYTVLTQILYYMVAD